MTNLTNERLDAVMVDCLLTEEEAANPDTVVVVGPGIMHTFGFSEERLNKHADDIHAMLLELGPAYRQVDPSEKSGVNGGGMSFLNMCMTEDGVQWTGLHSQQEKLYSLGIASGWALSPIPQPFWGALPGGMPYLIVLNERLEQVSKTTVQALRQAEGSQTVTVKTKTCLHCGKAGEVVMPADAYRRYTEGEHIQRAWPEGSAADREMLISGTHGPCFKAMFPEGD